MYPCLYNLFLPLKTHWWKSHFTGRLKESYDCKKLFSKGNIEQEMLGK